MVEFLMQLRGKVGGFAALFAGLLALVAVSAAPLPAAAETGFSGTVTDMSHAPVAGVEVRLLDPINGSQVGETVLTQADGTYQVIGIGFGTYKVSFQKKVDINDTTPATYYRNKLTLEQADILEVQENVVSPGIDAVVGSWGMLSGKVVNASGAPIQGIRVTACDLNGVPLASVPEAVTDAGGNYWLSPLSPGDNLYKVRFNGNSQYAGQWYGNVPLPADSYPLSVTASLTTNLASATLASYNVFGRVTNALGAGLSGIQVYLYDANFNMFPSPAVETGSDGSYAIAGVPPNTYVAVFTDPTSVYKKQYYHLLSSRPAPNITVTSGTPTTGIDAVLITKPGAPTGVSASAGNGQATVSFAAPAFDGGSTITSYTVTSSPGYLTATGSSSPLTVSGLSNGTAYTFTVTATSAVGTSVASLPSNSVTPAPPAVNGACGSANGGTFPSAPGTNLCSAGTASAVTGTGPWSWSCSGSNGGSTATCSAFSPAGTVNIPLAQGWNMISLPLQPSDTAVGSVLGAIGYRNVWSYSDGNWKMYDPNDPFFNSMNDMNSGEGYWIYVNVPGTLQVQGSAASASIPLGAGWNLVGYNSNSAQDVSLATQGIQGELDKVWSFKVVDGVGTWQLYDPADPFFNSLANLEPGMGYWVKMKQPVTWTLP